MERGRLLLARVQAAVNVVEVVFLVLGLVLVFFDALVLRDGRRRLFLHLREPLDRLLELRDQVRIEVLGDACRGDQGTGLLLWVCRGKELDLVHISAVRHVTRC